MYTCQASPGSGNGELFGNITLSDMSLQPLQVVSDQSGDNADFVFAPLSLNMPSGWRNREASVQAAQGKSYEVKTQDVFHRYRVCHKWTLCINMCYCHRK